MQWGSFATRPMAVAADTALNPDMMHQQRVFLKVLTGSEAAADCAIDRRLLQYCIEARPVAVGPERPQQPAGRPVEA